MIRLWHILMHGCVHRWKEDRRNKLQTGWGSTGERVYCTCEKCGRPAKFDLV